MPPDIPPRPAADLDRAIRHYDQLAPVYDHATRRIDGVRARAIGSLQLRPGDVVLDAGCGTGFCLPMIEAAIGPSGKVIGIEPSPAMLARARDRVDASGWRNVTLVESSGEAARLPAAPDAILFSYTHDLLRSPAGLDNLFAQSKPGARIAACGTQLFPRWFFPGNWYLLWSHRHYITNFDSFDAPWKILAERLHDFRVQREYPGERYLATGVLPAPGDRDSRR
jgi:SAM-dependent methyltransferase